MRSLPLAIAAILTGALAFACTTGNPTGPDEAFVSESAVDATAGNVFAASETPVKKRTRKGKKRRRIGPVLIDNNLPDGACPPPFRLRRGVSADRNGDGLVCVKGSRVKPIKPPRKRNP